MMPEFGSTTLLRYWLAGQVEHLIVDGSTVSGQSEIQAPVVSRNGIFIGHSIQYLTEKPL